MADKETENNINETNNLTQTPALDSSVPNNSTTNAPRSRRKKNKAINVRVIQEKSNHPAIANWISGIAAAISLGLGVVTLLLFWQTQIQTKAAQKSAAAAIAADSLSKIYNDSSIKIQNQLRDSQFAAKKQLDIADGKKLERDIDFFNKQKAGIDSQIAYFKNTKKQFEQENRPFINVTDIFIDSTNKKNISANYSLQNPSRQTIIIKESHSKIFITNDANLTSIDSYTENDILKNSFIAANNSSNIKVVQGWTNPSNILRIKKPNYVYIFGYYKNQSIISKKLYFLKFAYRYSFGTFGTLTTVGFDYD